MNKKLKKTLYMFGFALPIVAIPIITVACGTQTSQIEPAPAPAPSPAPEKEIEPKVETPEVIKPDLSVLKETNISENILSEDIKSLLTEWEKNKSNFKIESIKENKIYSNLISSYVDTNSNIKLKTGGIKFSDIIKEIPNLNFVDFFDISKLGIQNLDQKKLVDIKLSDVFSSDLNKLIEAIKEKKEEIIASESFKYDDFKKTIKDLINKNESSAFKKIENDFDKNSINYDDFKKVLSKLKFSELIDIEKLQEKLNQ